MRWTLKVNNTILQISHRVNFLKNSAMMKSLRKNCHLKKDLHSLNIVFVRKR